MGCAPSRRRTSGRRESAACAVHLSAFHSTLRSGRRHVSTPRCAFALHLTALFAAAGSWGRAERAADPAGQVWARRGTLCAVGTVPVPCEQRSRGRPPPPGRRAVAVCDARPLGRAGAAVAPPGRSMSSTRFDEAQDYGFADKALALREHAGLTQRELATLLGVSRRAIQAWEAGLSYPGAERLTQMIALYVERGAFPVGR